MEFVDLIPTQQLDNVLLLGPFNAQIVGTICITGHHLILSARKEEVKELMVRITRSVIHIYKFV